MKTWQEYLEEAKQKMNCEKIKEEAKALISSLQEKGLIEVIRKWDMRDFPFIQFLIRLPWRKAALDAIKTYEYENLTSCTIQEVKDFIDEETDDLTKNAFLLFAEDNIDKLAIAVIEKKVTRLLLHLGTITDKNIYLILAEKWEPLSEFSEEEEEEEYL